MEAEKETAGRPTIGPTESTTASPSLSLHPVIPASSALLSKTEEDVERNKTKVKDESWGKDSHVVC
ncbi:rCG61440 [Rattus norvegicus]|uniref:RCG61440 n=1 Tax=Rattus norvegicus TaxID=10116 RepID=A6HBJ2_RAT|nr:rCG61440 [Rattus norvegicus]